LSTHDVRGVSQTNLRPAYTTSRRARASGKRRTEIRGPTRSLSTRTETGGAGRVRSSSAFRMNSCSGGLPEEPLGSSPQLNRSVPALKTRAPDGAVYRTPS
jgi:hypothetical protein